MYFYIRMQQRYMLILVTVLVFYNIFYLHGASTYIQNIGKLCFPVLHSGCALLLLYTIQFCKSINALKTILLDEADIC